MATRRPPRLPEVGLGELVEALPGDLGPQERLDGFHVDGVDSLDLAGATVLECRLTGLTGALGIRGARFTECVIERSDLVSVDGARATWREVEVQSSRLGAADLFDAVLETVRLRDCRIRYLNLRGARVSDLTLTDCVIDELDLLDARVDRMTLAGCRIGRLDVSKSTLKDADLRGASFDAIGGVDALRGSTIDDVQLSRLAALLAAGLGILVES